MINYISDGCKQARKKSWDNWVGKVIRSEVCKRRTFDKAARGYMHKLESVLENETCKISWDFVISPSLFVIQINPDQTTRHDAKRFAVPADHRVKIKESKKINKFLGLFRELKTETLGYWCV